MSCCVVFDNHLHIISIKTSTSSKTRDCDSEVAPLACEPSLIAVLIFVVAMQWQIYVSGPNILSNE